MIRSARFILAAFALAAAAQAGAPNAVAVRHIAVSYRDLDLARAQDRAVLHERIAEAAAEACGGNPAFSTPYHTVSIYERKTFDACRARAMGEALAKLDAAKETEKSDR